MRSSNLCDQAYVKDAERRQLISESTGHMALLASRCEWGAVIDVLNSERTPDCWEALHAYAVKLRNGRVGLKNDKAYTDVSKQLMSSIRVEGLQQTVLCRSVARVVLNSNGTVDLVLLAPLITHAEHRELVFRVLFHLVSTVAWGDRFLESFKTLYAQLSKEQQAVVNAYFSWFPREDIEAAAFQKLSVAFLMATKDGTKPKTEAEKETFIMLKNVMPLRLQPGDVYLWQSAWLALYETFAEIQKETVLFSVTRSYIDRQYLKSMTYKDSAGVTMFLLAMCRKFSSEDMRTILEEIINTEKMSEVLGVLMQLADQSLSESVEAIRSLATGFINILREKARVVLRPEEAAYLCHLVGAGNCIAQTVMSLNSSNDLDAFQYELLKQALAYVQATDVPEDIDSQNPASIISYRFYFPSFQEPGDEVDGLVRRRKAIRILGSEVSTPAASEFLSELAYPTESSDEVRAMSIWDLPFNFVVPDPRVLMWLIVAASDEAEVDDYLSKAPLYLLTHFISGAFQLRQPALMLKGLRRYEAGKQGCRNNIHAMFDQLGLAICDEQGAFTSKAERFPIINLLLAHCIREVATPDIANLLAVFINTVRNEDVWHYLESFYTLAGPPLSVEALDTFKTGICSQESGEEQERLKIRTAAMLIYSLHPEKLPSSYVVRLLQSPHYFVEQVQQILRVFDFPSALGETEPLCDALRNFGMQEAVLQKLIALTHEDNSSYLGGSLLAEAAQSF